MTFNPKPFAITLPPHLAKAQELVRQALGAAPELDLKPMVASYRKVKPELRLEALGHDPWGGDPALGFAFVEEGRTHLKESGDEARSFALLGRQVAAQLLAPGPAAVFSPIREIAFDLAAGAATLYAEALLVDGNDQAALPWLKEAGELLAKGTGDPYPAVAFLHIQALTLWVGGQPRPAIALLRQAAELSASVEDLATEALAYLRESVIHASQKHEPKSRAAFRKALELYTRMSPEEQADFEAVLISLLRT